MAATIEVRKNDLSLSLNFPNCITSVKVVFVSSQS